MLLLFPNRMICYYGYNAVEFRDWNSVEVYAILFLSLILGYLFLKYLWSRPVLSFSIGFFIGGMLAISNMVKPIIGIIGERFVYFPSIAFVLLISLGLYELFRLKSVKNILPKSVSISQAITGTLACYAIYAALQVWPRNNQWQDRNTLFHADVQKAPESVKLNMLYGDNLLYDMTRRGNVNAEVAEKAQKYYEQAINVAPDYGQAYQNLSVAQAMAGEKDSSVTTMLEGRNEGKKVQPNSVDIAKELIQEDRLKLSGELLEAYIKDYGPDTEAYAILIQVYRNYGEFDKSYQAAIEGIIAIPNARNIFFRHGQLTAAAEQKPFKWADLLLEKGLVDTEQYDQIRTTIQRTYERTQN